MTHHSHPESIVHVTVHSQCCTCCGFGQVCQDMPPSLWYHTEYFHCLCALPIYSPNPKLWQPLIFFYHLHRFPLSGMSNSWNHTACFGVACTEPFHSVFFPLFYFILLPLITSVLQLNQHLLLLWLTLFYLTCSWVFKQSMRTFTDRDPLRCWQIRITPVPPSSDGLYKHVCTFHFFCSKYNPCMCVSTELANNM